MRFPVDADLVVFLYTASKIAFGSIPRLRRNVPKVPARYQIENVPLGSLTEAQTRYFAPYDKKLDAMNYWPVCTYRITNYGHCLLRQYVNPSETSRGVLIYELASTSTVAAPSGIIARRHSTSVQRRSHLTTRNAKLKTIFDRPPYQVVQECPQVSEPSEMKCIHDTRAQTMGCPGTPLSDPVSILKDVQSEHERFTAHQLSTAPTRPCPVKPAMPSPTGPLACHPQPSQPVRASLLPASVSARRNRRLSFPRLRLPELRTRRRPSRLQRRFFSVVQPGRNPARHLVAGAIIGYVLERQTFVWVFLLTDVLGRILPEPLSVPCRTAPSLAWWLTPSPRLKSAAVQFCCPRPLHRTKPAPHSLHTNLYSVSWYRTHSPRNLTPQQ